MPGAKIVVLYPHPTDVEVFERAYVEEHIPLVKAKIGGATKFTFTTVRGAVGAEPSYHRVTEVNFESMEALQASASTSGTQEAAKHGVAISSGGVPLFLIADEGTVLHPVGREA